MYKQRYQAVDVALRPPSAVLPSGGLRHEFMAWLPKGVLGPKVSGFLAEQDAEVVNVRPDELRLRIGRKRLLWNQYGDDFPLEVTLRLNHQTSCQRSLTHVIAEIKPLTRNVPENVRDVRLQEIVRALRYNFLAQELELV